MNNASCVTWPAAVLLGSSTAAFAGLTFTQITTVDGDRTRSPRSRATAATPRWRWSSRRDNPFMPAGSYMLFTDGEMLLVNPAARTYARFDTSMLEGMAGMAGQMEFTDVEFEKVVDEAGETSTGYPTRHYQFKSSWTMVMTGHAGEDRQQNTVEDLWTTTAIELPATAASSAGGRRVCRARSPALAARTKALRQVEGFPLKHVTVQSTKMNMGGGAGALGGLGGLGARMAGRMMGGGGGGNAETTTTIEVVDIEEVDVPAVDVRASRRLPRNAAVPDRARDTGS